MFGSYCLGIACDNPQDVILDAIDCYSDIVSSDENAIEKVRGFINLLKNSRTDQLGKRTILYFPDIEWEDDENEEEGEDNDEE